MKKQILFMMFLSLAFVFAGVNKVFAQPGLTTAPPSCLAPTTITAACLDLTDGTVPVAGVAYTYTVDVPTPPGVKSFHWFVTKEKDFINAGVLNSADAEAVATSDIIIAAGTSTPYNQLNTNTNGTEGFQSIDITWNYFVPDPANPVFLVVYTSNDADCDNDNIDYYIIEPVHSFTLDIAGIDLNGVIEGGTNYIPGPCAAPVYEAIWDATAQELQMNYGVNYLYFIVTAANFNHSWMPSFQVSGDGIGGLGDDRVVTAIDWQYQSTSNVAGVWNSSASAPAWDGTNSVYASTSGTAVAAQAGTAVGAAGECIIVRVTVDNGYIETIDTDDVITLAVDGIMYDSDPALTGSRYVTAALGDVHHTNHPTDPTNNCLWVDGFENDYATQVITVRPNLNPVTPDVFDAKEGAEDTHYN